MMIKNTTELCGQLVLVNPGLPYDPADRQNEIGIIAFADFTGDQFEVSFQDNEYGLYAADALLVIKPMHEINRLLLNQENQSVVGIDALAQLNQARRADIYHREWKILEVAMKYPVLYPLCLDTFGDVLPIRQSYYRQR